jgi:K+-sensing histidine kinase KdpD
MHGMMRRATYRLGILVQAMIDVDLLQRDLMPLVPTETSWSTIAAAAVEAALAAAATKEIVVVPRGEPGALVACDATLVVRMLNAMVEHAIGNAPAKSVVDLEGTRLDDGRFRMCVVHRGRLVSTTAIDKLFTTLPLRFCRLAAIRHGAVMRVALPVTDGCGLAFELQI